MYACVCFSPFLSPVDSGGGGYFDEADVYRLWGLSVRAGVDLDAVHRAGVSVLLASRQAATFEKTPPL